MSFHDAQTPEDLPDYEYESEVRRLVIETSTTEGDDTALTDWLGGYQPVLEPVEALLGSAEDDDGR